MDMNKLTFELGDYKVEVCNVNGLYYYEVRYRASVVFTIKHNGFMWQTKDMNQEVIDKDLYTENLFSRLPGLDSFEKTSSSNVISKRSVSRHPLIVTTR